MGEVTLSLPLEGHYRAGRYMPVWLTTHDEPGAITLSARGAMPTEVGVAGNFDGVVPWLAVSGSVHDPAWASTVAGNHPLQLPLRPLEEDEKLVALAGGESEIAKSLFPGKKIVFVTLDLSRPLLEPVEAWESLDAIVLSPAAAARLSEQQREALLACGTAIAVHSDRAPDLRWPWKQLSDYWVLHWDVAGPTSCLAPDAYTPTYGWERGWPGSFRRAVVFFGILYFLLASGITLWPSRAALLAFLILSIGTAGAFAWWYSRQSAVLELAAGVSVRAGSVEQFDRWTWQSPVRPVDTTFRSLRLAHPIFATPAQMETTRLRLVCGADGRPDRFTFHMDPGQSQAFLERSLRVGVPDQTLEPAARPFAEFVDALYVRAGDRILGQFSAPNIHNRSLFPVIVIQRAK